MINRLLLLFRSASVYMVMLLFLLLLVQRQCHHCPTCPETSSPHVEVITKVDTIPYARVIPLPQIIWRDTGTWHNAMQPVDTPAILRQFLNRNVYRRTLVDDSNALITLTDTVFQNKLSAGSLAARYYARCRTTVQTTTVLQPPRRKLFLGAELSVFPVASSLSPSLLYLSKSDQAYAVTYNPFNNNIRFTAWWKFRLRKK